MAHKNIEDKRRCDREYYLRHRDRRRKVLNEHRRAKVRKCRNFVNRVKLSSGCKVCEYNKCTSALCFHHLRDKDEAVAKLITQSSSIQRIKQEMRKCIVLCVRCHAELHAGEITLESYNGITLLL